jgi:hypothetical protein
MHDSEPAFPINISVEKQGEAHPQPLHGITVRDYFAAYALTGHCSNAQNLVAIAVNSGGPQSIARACYIIADAMLIARKG